MSALQPGDVLRLDAHVVASIVEIGDTDMVFTGGGCRWTENRAIVEVDRRAGRIRRIATAPRPSANDARQLIALRLASPHRAGSGAIVRDQADSAHLPLFGAADQGLLL